MTSEHLVASQVEHARLQALRTEETDSHASSRDALSQFGWTTAVSQRTGETYYLNEATGESTMTSLWRLLDKLFLRGGLQRYRAPQVKLTTSMKLRARAPTSYHRPHMMKAVRVQSSTKVYHRMNANEFAPPDERE